MKPDCKNCDNKRIVDVGWLVPEMEWCPKCCPGMGAKGLEHLQITDEDLWSCPRY